VMTKIKIWNIKKLQKNINTEKNCFINDQNENKKKLNYYEIERYSY